MLKTTARPSPLFLAIVGTAVLGGVLSTFGSEVLMTTGVVLLVLGGWAISLCLHEFGHALFAYRGGDLSVRAKGYLTLDPRRYTDWVLSLVLPLVILAIGGIPLPGGAVWINSHALRSRRVESLVSLAGPLANLVIGALLSLVVAFVPMPVGLTAGMAYLAFVQIIAFALNILPIPGLDGYGALEPYLSPKARHFGHQARPWAPLVLLLLIIGVPGVATVFFTFAHTFFALIGGNSDMAQLGQVLFRFWMR